MAAKAELRDVLVGQHVAVGRSVYFVTGGAALDAGCFVFVEIRTAFVGMTFQTGFIFETAQSAGHSGAVGIVTGSTSQDTFLETMAFV